MLVYVNERLDIDGSDCLGPQRQDAFASPLLPFFSWSAVKVVRWRITSRVAFRELARRDNLPLSTFFALLRLVPSLEFY